MSVPRTFFGHMVPGPVPIEEIDIPLGTYRGWDTGMTLYWIAQGLWDGFEGGLILAEKLGAEVIFTFGHSSTFRLPDTMCLPGTMVPKTEAWEDLIGEVLDRARGRIHAFEMWNEPNLESEFFVGGTVEQLLDLSQLGYAIIKARQPNAIVTTPSFVHLDRSDAVAFADEYFALGGARYADVVAFHTYGDLIADAQTLNALMAKHNVQLPIWCTETVGWEKLKPAWELGIERLVHDAHIPGFEDWNTKMPLGRKWRETYDRMTAPTKPSPSPVTKGRRGCLLALLPI